MESNNRLKNRKSTTNQKKYKQLIIYINFNELFNKALKKILTQQMIKYKCPFYFSGKSIICLNRYNLLIDTVLAILAYTNDIINNIKNKYIKKFKNNFEINMFATENDKFTTPKGYYSWLYSKPAKKFVSSDIFIKMMAIHIKYTDNIYATYKYYLAQSLIKNIQKYIETKKVEIPDYIKNAYENAKKKSKEDKKKPSELKSREGKGKAKEDIEILLEKHPDDWKEYIIENMANLKNGYTSFYLTKKQKKSLKIIRRDQPIINSFKQFYIKADKDYWDNVHVRKVNVFQNNYIPLTSEQIKEKIFFIQNYLTPEEITDIYYYVFFICSLNCVDNIDISDEETKYIIISKSNVIDSELLTDYNNKITKPDNITFKKFTSKKETHIANMPIYKLLDQTSRIKILNKDLLEKSAQHKKQNYIKEKYKNITLAKLIKKVKTRNPLMTEVFREKYKGAEIFLKYIIDIDYDRKLNFFMNYDPNVLYNNFFNKSIIEPYKHHMLYEGILLLDETEDYLKPLTFLMEKYKYDYFNLI